MYPGTLKEMARQMTRNSSKFVQSSTLGYPFGFVASLPGDKLWLANRDIHLLGYSNFYSELFNWLSGTNFLVSLVNMSQLLWGLTSIPFPLSSNPALFKIS
jgi:hypothetical protein